jgi:hypothetical protein
MEVIGDRIPITIFSVSVFDGGGIGKSEQVLVGEGQLHLSAIVDEVLAQGGLWCIDGFFSGGFRFVILVVMVGRY